MLAVDTETRSLIWREGVESVFMVQWADAHGEHFCTVDEGWDRFLAAIAEDDLLVFANASFDIHHLRASGVVDLLNSGHRLHDVTTLARVALPGRQGYKPYGLEALGTDLLGADATEAQRSLAAAAKLHGVPWTIQNRDYYALWRAEPELLERYGMEDVRLTYDLFKLVYARALASDIDVYRTEITGVAPLLRAAERDGVLVHKPRLAELRARLESERDELRCRLLAQGLSEEALGALDEDGEAGAASSKALLADLLRCGVPLYRLTKTSGKPKIDRKTGTPKRDADGKIIRNPNQLAVNKDALTEFQERFPVVGDLMDWRGRKQVLSTYVGALELADPRVHASFSQCEARTSRMSASRPNMQNLPTPDKERADGTYDVGVRHVLIPGPGMALMSADFDSIEVRALAHYLADPELTAQLDAGLDLHQRTAYRVALANGERCQFEDFVKGGSRDKDRTVAKVTTFCVPQSGTQILTRRGWQTHDTVLVGDETLGYRGGRAEWTTITGVHRFDEGELVRLRHSSFEATCTPGHRWLADRRGWSNNRAYTAPELTPIEALSSEHRLHVAAPADGGQLRVSPDEAAVIAWALTDGHIRISEIGGRSQAGGTKQFHGVTLIQAKPRHVESIDALLERLQAPHSRATTGAGVTRWQISSPWARELWRRAGVGTKYADLTGFVLGLSEPAREAFVAACMDAEGHVTTKGRRSFAQNVGPVLDGFQLAAFMCGDRATRLGDRMCPGGNFLHSGISLKRPTVGMQKTVKEPAGRAPVWCVSTALGSWTMRQGRDIMLTGNTALYGGGARLLSTRLNISVEAAAKIKADTLAAIPGYHELDDRVKRAVMGRPFPHVVTILGRRIYIPRAKPYVALNGLIQSTSAELMKLAMIAAAPVLAEYGWAIRLVVHDELVAEGPVACADEVLAATIRSMEGAYPLSPRLKATGSWSTDSYGRAK